MTSARGDLYARLTCREVIEQYLADYVDGVLSRDVAAKLERPDELARAIRTFLLERLGL